MTMPDRGVGGVVVDLMDAVSRNVERSLVVEGATRMLTRGNGTANVVTSILAEEFATTTVPAEAGFENSSVNR